MDDTEKKFFTEENDNVISYQILRELIFGIDDDYKRTIVNCNIDEQLFQSQVSRELFKAYKDCVKNTGKIPNAVDLIAHIETILFPHNTEKRERLKNEIALLEKSDTFSTRESLLEKTSEWIKRILIQNILLEGQEILSNHPKTYDANDIYTKLGTALNFSFDKDLGVKGSDMIKRLKMYEEQDLTAASITGIEGLDKMLGGGFRRKTLNMIGGTTHSGKSLMLIQIAAQNYLKGQKVIYISLEMTELEIWKRLDCHIAETIKIDLFNFKLSQINAEVLTKKHQEAQSKGGELTVKEFSAGTCTVGTIRKYIDDLVKENPNIPKFDLICVDYLTLMKPQRNTGSEGTLFQAGKYISEELHGLAKELEIPVVTAFQLNRNAFGNLDAGLETTSESIAIAQTADTIMFIIRPSADIATLSIKKNRNTGQFGHVPCIFNAEFMKLIDKQIFEDTRAEQWENEGKETHKVEVEPHLGSEVVSADDTWFKDFKSPH